MSSLTTESLNPDLKTALGPLAAMVGVWQGVHGDDLAPSDDRGTENNKFRETISFVPFGPVQNHEQTLFGLKYARTAWRLGEESPFHEEMGYWFWDAQAKQVFKSFLIPRGLAALAGATIERHSTDFTVVADAGSDVYGICSNPFLDREFKTVRYEQRIVLRGKSLTYEEDTQLRMKGRPALFHHRDRNTLERAESVEARLGEPQ